MDSFADAVFETTSWCWTPKAAWHDGVRTLHVMSLSCFFDIAAALPSLGRQWLFQALNQFQFEMGFVKAVAALCDWAMGFTILNGQCTVVCPLASGVAQGCPSSGATWAIAMD
eukprot:675698-Pyramimonas_sp.AAC.1